GGAGGGGAAAGRPGRRARGGGRVVGGRGGGDDAGRQEARLAIGEAQDHGVVVPDLRGRTGARRWPENLHGHAVPVLRRVLDHGAARDRRGPEGGVERGVLGIATQGRAFPHLPAGETAAADS